MRRASLDDPRYFLNRHLSWLQFNLRVLEEAADSSNPLLERVKFLAITVGNLDEFVEVRVAGLPQQAEQKRGEIGPDALAPSELLPQLTAKIQDFVKDQYTCASRITRWALHYFCAARKKHRRFIWTSPVRGRKKWEMVLYRGMMRDSMFRNS